MSMPTPSQDIEHGLTQVDQEIPTLSQQAGGFVSQAIDGIDALIASSEVQANGFVQQIMHECDMGLVEATTTIKDLQKQIGSALDGQMMQVAGVSGPLVQSYLSAPQQTASQSGFLPQITCDQGTQELIANATAYYNASLADLHNTTLKGYACDALHVAIGCLQQRGDTSSIALISDMLYRLQCEGGVVQPPGTRPPIRPIPYPLPPSTQPPATCPPPCAPPVISVSCADECKDEKGKEKKQSFTVWQERDTNVCAVTESNQPPDVGVWQFSGTYDSVPSAENSIAGLCKKPKVRSVSDSDYILSAFPDTTNPANCSFLNNIGQFLNPNNRFVLSQLLGLRDSKGKETDWSAAAGFKILGVDVGLFLQGLVRELVDDIDLFLGNTVGRTVAVGGIDLSMILTQGVINICNILLGGGAFPIKNRTEHVTNYLIPNQIPDANAATEAYIRNSLSKPLMDCLVRMNGQNPQWWNHVVDARRSKMSPFELTALWRRGQLTTIDHTSEIRGLGFLDQQTAQRYRELSVLIPPSSDLVRLMIRDAADETIPFWKEADKLFTQKYAGKVKEWGEQQGVQEDFMRLLWRAHFGLPAPNQLYTFYHRFRQDKKLWPSGDPLKDMKETLIQQDILPDWVDLYIKTSFRPINRVDTRRAFTIGAMDEKQLKQSYRNQGYDDDSVATLVDFTKLLREQTLSRSPAARSYRDGGFNRSEAKAALQTGKIPEATIDKALDLARNLRVAKVRQICAKTIERRFLVGEIDEKEARQELIAQGHEQQDVDDFMAGFICRRQSRSKTIPATTICGLVDDGIIPPDEMFDRLIKLGYSVDDATNLVKRCNLTVSRKRRRAAIAATKETVRLARAAESSRKSRLKSQDRRLGELAKAAEDLAKGEGMILPDALARVNATFAALQYNFAASMDEALQVIRMAAKQTGFDVETLFEVAAAVMLQQRRQAATPPLTTIAESAAVLSTRRILQCVNCFHQAQASDSTKPLKELCPVCGQPMTVVELINQYGGNGEARG